MRFHAISNSTQSTVQWRQTCGGSGGGDGGGAQWVELYEIDLIFFIDKNRFPKSERTNERSGARE